MPKTMYVINDWKQGLNTSADARDIQDDESAELIDVAIHRMGKLTMLGGFTEHESTDENQSPPALYQNEGRASTKPGLGLFAFDADNKVLSPNAGNLISEASGTDYKSSLFFLYNTGNSKTISIFQKTDDGKVWSNTGGGADIDLGAGTAEPIFYNADGAIRIIDSSGTAGNISKWFGLITPKIYGGYAPQTSSDTQTYHTDDNVYYVREEASVYRTSSETGSSGVGATSPVWVAQNTHIEGAFPTEENDNGIEICTNAVVANTESKYTQNWASTNADCPGFGFGNEKIDTGTTHKSDTSQGFSNMRWGIGMVYRESLNGTWQSDKATRFRFYITTLYDDGTQESLPQLMAMYGAEQLVPKSVLTDATIAQSTNAGRISTSAGGGLMALAGLNEGQFVDIVDNTDSATNNNFTNVYITSGQSGYCDFVVSDTDSTPIAFGTDRAGNGNITITGNDDCDYTGVPAANDNLNFSQHGAADDIYLCDSGGTTGIDLEGKNNAFGKAGTNLQMHMAFFLKINGTKAGNQTGYAANNPPESNAYVFGNGSASDGTTYGNPRISGVRLYYGESDDGYGDIWQFAEIDFAKGCKATGLKDSTGETGWIPFKSITRHNKAGDTGVDGTQNPASEATGIYLYPDFPASNRWDNPPKLVSYFTNNGHDHTDTINLDYAKTVVIANRRAYAGNIAQTVDGLQEVHRDRIIKSPINQFDKFPSKNFVEAAVNDGDEIIHLATFADRILQFNKHVMYIINIAQEAEFIEEVNKFKGIDAACNVCTTDMGIAWGNKLGAYFYDGKDITNILESKGDKQIDINDWKEFAKNGDLMAGYIPSTRQVMFADSASTAGTGQIYLYDIVKNSFTKGYSSTVQDRLKSNFTNEYNGDLIYYDYHNDNMMKWEDTPESSSYFEYKTRDTDWARPAEKKKVYKIYVTHKGSTSNLKISYSLDGQDSWVDTGTSLPESSNSGTGWSTTAVPINVNNCYSIQFRFKSNGLTPANFEINDISIVYRAKGIK